MPKPRSRIATGMSVPDILRMPISKLQEYTPTQQREIVSRLGSAANKRLKNLSNSGIVNSATLKLDASGGKISVRGKSGGELVHEFIRAREFLDNKFSSKKEWNRTIKNLKKNETIASIRDVDVGKVFGMYDYLRELEPEITNKLNKYVIQDYIADQYVSGKSQSEIAENTLSWIQQQYNKQREQYEKQSTRFADTLENDIPKRIIRKRKRKR